MAQLPVCSAAAFVLAVACAVAADSFVSVAVAAGEGLLQAVFLVVVFRVATFVARVAASIAAAAA